MSQPVFGAGAAPSVTWPPDPIANPLAWDKVEISGVISPGLARVGEFKRRWIWDEKKGKGQPKASLTLTGAHLARGSIEFWLLTGPDLNGGMYTDLQDWVTFAKLFNYQPLKEGGASAVDVYHPSLAVMDLKSFLCEDVGNPVRMRDGDSLYSVKVSLIEYAPPQPVNVTATVTKTKANPPQETSPPGTAPVPADVAQRQATIDELRKKLPAK